MRRIKKWAAHLASTIATKMALWAYEDAEGSFYDPEPPQDLPAINAAVIARFNHYLCTYHDEPQDHEQAVQDFIAEMDLVMERARQLDVPCFFAFAHEGKLELNLHQPKHTPQALIDAAWPIVASGIK